MANLRQIIEPGLCPVNPSTGLPECPPPDRIECILVDKVYDSCFQLDNISRTTVTDDVFSAGLVVNDLVNCVLDTDTGIECTEVGDRVAVGDGYFRVTLAITVPITLTNPVTPTLTFDSAFTFMKTVVLCAPEGVRIDCSASALLGCSCIVTAVDGVTGVATVTCDLQICVVIQSLYTVQLLVPSYGFCIPTQCASTVCPPVPPVQCPGQAPLTSTCSCS